MKQSLTSDQSNRRRGVAAVYTMVVMLVLLGCAALTIDVGVMYNTRADLQDAADAAALAAAAKLSDYRSGDAVAAAREAAVEYVARNAGFNGRLAVDPATDITFGRANYDAQARKYTLTPTEALPDTVRVRVRATSDSPNGPTPLYFARIFGIHSAELAAEAVALMAPRDIAITVDLSGSINDDSELQHHELTDVNLYDVWDALPGGIDEIGGLWDEHPIPPEWIEPDGSAPQAAGPAWGYLKELGFGEQEIGADYDPTVDSGLTSLAYGQDWTEGELKAYLDGRGYSQGEIAAIVNDTYDANGDYAYRVAVALGLATWNSGKTDGLWAQHGVDPGDAGDADNRIEGSELTWDELIFELSYAESRDVWLDYVGHMRSSWSTLAMANPDFRYRYGIKTFISYLLSNRASHEQTPEFADVPAQPMQAVKDAAVYMVDLLEELDTNDQLSLEVYATTARHEVDLTNYFREVSDRLMGFQAGHYDSRTNMGAGLERAIEELTSDRARSVARKVIVLLTDGRANVDENGNYGEDGGKAHTLSLARKATALGIRVFAVSVGAGADQSLMQEIADMGGGEHFHAEGTIDEYSEQLGRIFTEIGGRRTVELIQ